MRTPGKFREDVALEQQTRPLAPQRQGPTAQNAGNRRFLAKLYLCAVSIRLRHRSQMGSTAASLPCAKICVILTPLGGGAMSGTANDFASMHFSSDALPEHERAAMVRDFVGPVVARLEIEPLGDGPLHFEMAARAVPELAVSTLTFSALRIQRTRALIADGNDNCQLSWLHSPGNTVVSRGNELAPRAGEGTLLSMSDPFACTTVSGARGMTVSVPRKLLIAMVPGLEDSFGSTLIPASEALRLLASYAGLLDQQTLENPELRRL